MTDRCRTRYPIVLVHGAGFRDLRWPLYWGRIPSALTACGAQVFYGLQDAWGSAETNAAALAARIARITEEADCARVNIIAHSKGGIDARLAACQFGCADRIASITTVATPHRGSQTLDRLYSGASSVFSLAALAVDNWIRLVGDRKPDFLKLCEGVFECISEFTSPTVSEKARAVHDFDLLFKTAGYCTEDVMDSLDVPEEAQKLLSPYWLYVGSPLSDLPFTIYALLAGDYIGHGSRIPLKFSHEMALKMAEKAEELGAEIEYRQRVRKILTENGKVSGVVTERGDRITADLVISGAYPAPVFTEMIDPPSAVSPEVLRALKSRQYSFTVFTVLLMLDRPAEALGIRNYCIFTGECTDSERIFHENLASSGPYEALIGVCLEKANPEAVPENTCSFSITALLRAEAFRDVHAENYEERRHEIAEQLIDRMSERLQVPLRSHIQEIVIVSPETISRFSGSPAGSNTRASMKGAVRRSLTTSTGAGTIRRRVWRTAWPSTAR